MEEHSSTYGQHGGGHGNALPPQQTLWPIVLAAATIALGIALVWWFGDKQNDVAGPLLGGTVLLTAIAAYGWFHDDQKAKRQIAEGTAEAPRNARYTQVITFSIAEGSMVASRLPGGVLETLGRSDSALRGLPGFQDVRIIASPAAAGPSQVIVETTWSNREGLATYDETRRTLLDLVASKPEEVVAGSLQVFDMEVVRDTKPMGFSLGLGSVAALLSTLVIFGFMAGAGLNLFGNNSSGTVAADGGGAAAGPNNVVTATDNKFDKTTLEAPPNTAVTFEFKNNGKAKHNIHFLDKAGGATLAPGGEGAIIDGGAAEPISFTTPGAGSYYYQCDLHPDTMKGTFTVKEGAPVPGAAAAAGGGAAPAAGLTLVSTDNKFDKSKLEATAGDITVTLKNNGKVKHNVHFLDKKGGATLAPGAEGAIIDGGASEPVKFKAMAGSYYYQCDLHPDTMFGTLTVK